VLCVHVAVRCVAEKEEVEKKKEVACCSSSKSANALTPAAMGDADTLVMVRLLWSGAVTARGVGKAAAVDSLELLQNSRPAKRHGW
jgi:hypothetical protein